MIESVCVVFVIVVEPQGEVCADLHLLGEGLDNISPEELISDSFELFRPELRPRGRGSYS